MIATLGRRDQLVADGTLDQLLQSLARFSERLRVVERVRTEGLQAQAARAWGPALVFGRLREMQGLPELLRARATDRRFEFDVERVAFVLAWQRLCAPGSDLQGAAWVRTVECPGFEALDLQHFSRTVGWLAQVRTELETDHPGPGRTSLAPSKRRGGMADEECPPCGVPGWILPMPEQEQAAGIEADPGEATRLIDRGRASACVTPLALPAAPAAGRPATAEDMLSAPRRGGAPRQPALDSASARKVSRIGASREARMTTTTRLASLDLRAALARLDGDGQLLRVRREVDPKFELAAVTRRVQLGPNLPVLFEKVRGTPFRVVSNVYGNYGIVARMLGTELSGVAATWAGLMTELDRPGLAASPGEAPPVREVPFAEVPHITYCEKDAGPYLTASVVLARDPDTGVPNLSYHRMQMIDATELRVRLSPAGDLYRMQEKAERRGQALPVAVLLGSPPAVNLAGAAAIPAGTSELALAERIAGRRLPMRRCASVDLDVPAEAEMVVEGEILPNVRRPEGPFGEWQDYYVPVMNNHVLQVHRVVAREDGVFHAICSGSTEELTLSAIPNAALIYRAVRAFDPSVKDVVCYPWPQFCVVQIKKRYEGQPQKVMLGAMGAETNRLLYCVVVDEDVDIHDLRDVVWAMSTRCRPDRGVMQIPNVPSFARDPHQVHWGRLGIDATAPLEWAGEFERKRYPGLDAIRLEDYL